MRIWKIPEGRRTFDLPLLTGAVTELRPDRASGRMAVVYGDAVQIWKTAGGRR